MDKLNFICGGIPKCSMPNSYNQALKDIKNFNLDGIELAFVHGVRMSADTRMEVKKLAKQYNLIITAHAPYYINLNAKEEEKIDASINRIIQTAEAVEELGGYSIVFHAGFYLKQEKDDVYKKIYDGFNKIMQNLSDTSIWIRPETTGKSTQWGDLDEVIKISKEFDKVLPCIDFAHLHARDIGIWNTYDEFSKIFEKIGNNLGDYALKNFHAHIAGINYGNKGEKNHLMLDESDFNYKDLLKAFKDFDIKGTIVCESPIPEDDAILIKKLYNSL